MAQSPPEETDGSGEAERSEESAQTKGGEERAPSLWRNRDYLSWWTGNGLSTLGTSVSTLAFPLLMLYETGSATQAGTITVLHMLGKLGTLAVGGALADRISRRAILCVVPLIEALAMGAVALLVYRGDPAVLALDLLALVSGLAAGLKIGVSTPVLRRVVPKEQIANATAQGMGRDMVLQLLGAPLGGLLYSAARWIPFLFDALSFVFVTLGTLFIRRPLGPDRKNDEQRPGLLTEMGDGLRMIRRSDYLRFTIAWGALLNTVAQGFTLLFIVLVQHRGGSPTAVGVVTSLAVAGGVVGAVLGPTLMQQLGARRVLHAAAWIFVASFAVVGLVPEPWQIGLVMMVGMISMVPMNVVTESYEVRLVPDAYLGRVAATSRFCFQGVQWVGPLAAGVLADTLGPESAALVLAGVMAVLAVVLHLGRRNLALLDSPLADVQELPAPNDRDPQDEDPQDQDPEDGVLTGPSKGSAS
ncbi:hypothetical protein BN159_6056 [Streptomyces davaonensis JCM 4913]|uniref:Major facilitator superfamily (MFS) profile domain-containing protein n=1 Tax=Streptomyces davaonensis (strain DSM 101723 / JCM 4913 / KCC S-0913 / 768) TaxID=1214101 RepID=K4RB63_STRDJ|nr:MFS transporter [Streptomyces davaonensis]CCK30435.1 hypothetical protein BN159_6056 [Streptomyces davaonensis JCM 4913]